MRFSIEESELINSFFADYQITPSRETVLAEIERAKDNTQEPELVEIAESTINKIRSLDETTYNRIFSEFPINSFTTY